jgi:mannose-6-phosphate isomerase-like protein (cupin superfamily)
MQEGLSFARLDLDALEDGRFVRLRRELGVSTFGLNAIVLAPGQRGRIHSHERQEEVYLVLEGRLRLTVEGEDRELGPMELARVAPEVRRQLTNPGPERLVLLAMGGAEPHEGRDGIAYESWEATEGRPPAEMPLPPDLPG